MSLSGPIRVYIGLILFSIIGTAGTKFLKIDPGWIAPLAAAATLLSGAYAAVRTCFPRRLVLRAAAVGVLAEIVGLWTGYPFGRYEYTSHWFPTVALGPLGFFPLLLPVAWLMIVGAAERLARPLPTGVAIPAVGAIAALIDLVLEPVATGPLGYWRWLVPGPLPGGAPWMNLGGWFLVSCLGAAILRRSTPPTRPERHEAGLLLLLYLALLATIWLAR